MPAAVNVRRHDAFQGSPAECRAEVDATDAAAWDPLLANFADATYDQTAAASLRWGHKRLSRLALRRDGQIVAGAQAVILTVPGLGKGLAYVKFGPFWRRSGEAPEPGIYREAVSALVSEYCVRRGHALTILPRPSPDHHELEAAVLRECGFRQRRRMSDANRYFVNLAIDSAEQSRSLDQKWRYNLRQALRAGIECRASNDPDDFAAFAALNASTQSRKGFRESETIRLMPALAGELPPSMRPWVVTAAHDGVPVAGAVVAALGDTAYYVFGASSEAGLPLKAGYALQWWIVSWLAGRGVRWYDLGGEAHEPGLRQFKKGLTGKAGAIVPMGGEFDAWHDPVGRLVSEGIYGARAAKGAMQALFGRTAR